MFIKILDYHFNMNDVSMIEYVIGYDKGIRIVFKNGITFRFWIKKLNYKELKSCPIQNRLKNLLIGNLNHNKKLLIGNRRASRSFIYGYDFKPNECR